jgi:hypothetical protein
MQSDNSRSPTSGNSPLISNRAAQKTTKYLAVVCTIIYSILFPFLFYMGLLSSMIFDNPRMTVPVGLSIIALTLLISLSIPISIYLTWSRYLRGLYRRAIFFCALPLIVSIGAFIIISLLEALLRYFVPIPSYTLQSAA